MRIIQSFAIIVFFFTSGLIYANDGPLEFSYGGSVSVLNNEHSSISMDSEIVKVYYNKFYYRVVAEFSFYNSGDSTSILMGFPENESPEEYERYTTLDDIDHHTNYYANIIESIKSFVDGKEVKLELQLVKTHINGRNKIHPYWVKKVKFEKNQRLKILVKYVVKYSPLEYNFTGGAWKGKVKHSKLIIYPQEEYIFWDPVPKDIKLENGNYVFEKYDWEAEYKFNWHNSVKYSKISDIRFFKDAIIEFYNVNLNELYNFGNFGIREIGIFYNFYLIKDYDGNEQYRSKSCFHIFKDYPTAFHYWDIKHISYNVVAIIRNSGIPLPISNNEYDIFNFNKSYFPVMNTVLLNSYDGEGDGCLIPYNINNYQSYFFINAPTISDSIRIITDLGVRNSDHEGRHTNNEKNALIQINNNLSNINTKFLEYDNLWDKVFNADKIKNIIEAYVLQMIFIGKDEQAWKYFDEHFPLFCSKQKSKDRILEAIKTTIELKERLM